MDQEIREYIITLALSQLINDYSEALGELDPNSEEFKLASSIIEGASDILLENQINVIQRPRWKKV